MCSFTLQGCRTVDVSVWLHSQTQIYSARHGVEKAVVTEQGYTTCGCIQRVSRCLACHTEALTTCAPPCLWLKRQPAVRYHPLARPRWRTSRPSECPFWRTPTVHLAKSSRRNSGVRSDAVASRSRAICVGMPVSGLSGFLLLDTKCDLTLSR